MYVRMHTTDTHILYTHALKYNPYVYMLCMYACTQLIHTFCIHMHLKPDLYTRANMFYPCVSCTHAQ